MQAFLAVGELVLRTLKSAPAGKTVLTASLNFEEADSVIIQFLWVLSDALFESFCSGAWRARSRG